MPLNDRQALQKLSSIQQEHLLHYWKDLSSTEQNWLLQQIEQLDIACIRKQQHLLKISCQQTPDSLLPFTDLSYSGNNEDFLYGKQMISEGLMGCLIVAGGQGSRLGFHGPKGLFPISPVAHKSLFQIFSEKVLAASKQAKTRLPLAIMTSPLNHHETVDFFESNQFFGLEKAQVTFFKQTMLPLINEAGNLFLETEDTLAAGPDGNGSALHQFYRNGIWHAWQARGIKHVNFVVVDNPLADPFDAELLGFHLRSQNEVTIKSILRENAQEKVGVLARQNTQTVIVEYSELPEALSAAILPNGALQYSCANLSLFCFSMEFIKKAIEALPEMPLHLAFKAANCLQEKNARPSTKSMAWKFEKFIFDILPLTNKIRALIYPREECFAPLKNEIGPNSISTVQAALQKSDRRVFSKISGHACKLTPFEIAQDFYYPTPKLLEKWFHRPAPTEGWLEP